jgi:lysophospholipid acyltransferase (LPLAT)-like uncharacterized protein
MSLLRRMTKSAWFQKAVGLTAAYYLRLVWHTTRVTIEPTDVYGQIPRLAPIILAFWHGQHFMTPFVKPKGLRAKVLVSRHRDGEINAIAAEHLGIETVRGSGTHGTDFTKKGGVFGFNALVRAVREGINVAMTADVPKVSRVAGLGIVKLAQVTGRPIIPVAIATHWRITLKNWDRTTVHLPFSRGAMVAGALIYVPQEADDKTLELARQAVEDALNAATQRAYDIVDGLADGDARG